MLARLEVAFKRERAFVVRRLARAAHAAGDPAHRARAGAARRAHARGARGGAALGRRGDRAALAARRGPARDRALGPGPAAGAARAARRRRRCSRASPAASRRAPRPRAARWRADPSPGVELDADPARLEQALANLVDNALSYGDGTVALSARDGRTAASSCTCATRARASRPTSCRARSSASRAPTRRARAAAPGSASRSPRRSPSAHGGTAHAANGDARRRRLDRAARMRNHESSHLLISLMARADPCSDDRHASAGGRGRDQDGEPDPARSAFGRAGGRRGHQGRGCALDGRLHRLRRDRARRDAPGHRRLRDVPAPA